MTLLAARIYALFFLSGISGLVYQVVWVRVFGNIFGNTVFSAATVSAVFLCGLGVGGYVVGRWADRRSRDDLRTPLAAYGWFELGIAALGLAVALVLPHLEALSSAFSSYRAGPHGWLEPSLGSHLFRQALAVVLLAPITLLMGGTLTLLIRYLVARDLALAGWRIGLLYGLNTLGAAFGAFLTDFALIPALGIFSAELVAVAINALVGGGALWLARRVPERAAAAEAAAIPAPPEAAPADAPRRVILTGIALFLSGLAAMGMEILWLRFLINVIGAYRAVFSLLLTVMLVGICLGSLAGGWLNRRWGRPVPLFIAAQTLFVLATLGELASFDLQSLSRPAEGLERAFREAGSTGQLLLQTWFNLRAILDVVGLPALLMGFSFPLANAHVQRVESAVGGRAGLLYLATTLGNVVGSLLAGFVLLPWLGLQTSFAVLAVCVALGVFAIQLSANRDPLPAGEHRLPVYPVCVVLLALALAGWSTLPSHRLIKRPRLMSTQSSVAELNVLSLSEGVNESILVLEVPGVERRLYTNGHTMSSTHPMSQRYMRLFSHLPLLQMEHPTRVLVICFGVGNTLHAASLHPSVQDLDAVDISKNVVRHGAFFNEELLRDPKLQIHINDGRQHLRMQPPESYDLITLEPPPINFAGVASLYSREFYELAASRLVQGGMMTQWLPAYQVPGETQLAMIRAFIDVFPNSVLLSGYQREFILMGVKGASIELDLERALARLRDNPALRADLERIEAGSATELFGTFVAGPAGLERATRGIAPVSDDRPLMEYGIRAHLHETRIPEAIFDVDDIASWCPDCVGDNGARAKVDHLQGYLAALDACYRSERFREFTTFDVASRRHQQPQPLPDDPEVRAAVRESRYLQRLSGPPCYLALPPAPSG